MLKNLVDDAVSVADIDEALITFYPVFDVPVDEILRDPTTAKDFMERLRKHMGVAQKLDAATVNLRLLTLRKRGEANGGLPRLQRQYRGRQTKPR